MKRGTFHYSIIRLSFLLIPAVFFLTCVPTKQGISVQGKKVLVFTKNGEGYVHDNLTASIAAIEKLGREHGFAVDASDDASVMTEDNLKQYDALIFSNSNNNVFDTDAQKLAFQRYIQAGGGFVGIHIASGTERKWDWFAGMVGARFLRHPKLQSFDIKVVDTDHPSTAFLPSVWHWEDECYFQTNLNPDMHVLLAADLNTVEDDKKVDYPGTTFGHYFPLCWYHEFDGGRQWYTALGHKIEYYSNPDFLQHVMGGIQWVLSGTGKMDYSKAETSLKLE
ncbi:MAG: ThuA domain-containing protein [Saprospiraceae bacterium]